MEYLEIKGERVPALGFGTWQLRGEICRAGVLDALEIGYRQIDTARAYENEAEVGRAINESGVPRQELFVTTKLWSNDVGGAQVGPATEESLEALDIGYIDLLLIHWPSQDVPVQETLDAMVVQKEQGKVRHIGVSNFKTALLQEAMEYTEIFADQVPYQPGRTQRSLCEVCPEADIMLTAYSPLAKGDVARDATLEEIGRAHGKSAAQVALRWLLQQPNVSPIPRSSSQARRRENFDVFDFELTDEEMDRIFALGR